MNWYTNTPMKLKRYCHYSYKAASCMMLQTWCGQMWGELAVMKCRERNVHHGAVAGSALPVTGTSWESWSGMTGPIVPGQTGSVWSFLSLWPLCWRLTSAESGLQQKQIRAANSGQVRYSWLISILQNCQEFHWCHKWFCRWLRVYVDMLALHLYFNESIRGNIWSVYSWQSQMLLSC